MRPHRPPWQVSTGISKVINGTAKLVQQHVVFDNYTTSTIANMTVTVSMLALECDQATDASFAAAMVSSNSSTSFQAAVGAISALQQNGDIQINGTIVASLNTGWPLAGYPIIKGPTLIIGPSEENAILDFMMNSSLILLPVGPAYLQNLTLVNLCSALTTIAPGLQTASSFSTYAFSRPW